VQPRGPGGEDAHVAGSLHEARNVEAHGVDALRALEQPVRRAAGTLLGHGFDSIVGRRAGDADVRIGDRKFVAERGFQLTAGVGQHAFRALGHGQNSGREQRDGIVLETARGGNKPKSGFLQQHVQQTAHQLIGTGTALVDLFAGVAAAKARDGDGKDRILPARGKTQRNRDDGAGTARTAYGKDALILGVKVQHPAALEHGGVERLCAQHADLLVGREHGLDRGAGNGRIVQQSQHHGGGNAVVTAQRGAVSREKVTLDTQTQGVFGKIKVAVRSLFSHHVQVALENDGSGIFIACGCRRLDDDVVGLVLIMPQPACFGETDAVVADGLCIPRTMRNAAELLKIIENRSRFELFQNAHDKRSFVTSAFQNRLRRVCRWGRQCRAAASHPRRSSRRSGRPSLSFSRSGRASA